MDKLGREQKDLCDVDCRAPFDKSPQAIAIVKDWTTNHTQAHLGVASVSLPMISVTPSSRRLTATRPACTTTI